MLKLGCPNLQSQDKCVSCLSVLMCQGHARVWNQSQKASWPGRVAANSPLGYQHDGPGLQALELGWLVFLFIETEKRLKTDWVHMLHNPWWKSVSSVFLMEQNQMTEKNYPLQQKEKQTINHHLIYVECLHRVLHSVIINHLVGRWRYYHSSTEEEREMQRVWSLHMITQLASGHEEFWPLAICL